MSALPIGCFAGALATDVVYQQTSEIQWANFSAWFLAFGMVLG
ncbi:MAG: Membrane protein, partial [Hyphomicrobiales bacterium]|nr:Membrane protein [Hyphomicrobiales bacterium]